MINFKIFLQLGKCQKFLSQNEDEVEVSNILQRAIQALSERPVLFRYTLDEYATARRSTTVRGFIDALTRGSRDQAQPRPIELHSHDPLRYVGDMAAWLHQCAATEVKFGSSQTIKYIKFSQFFQIFSSIFSNLTTLIYSHFGA